MNIAAASLPLKSQCLFLQRISFPLSLLLPPFLKLQHQSAYTGTTGAMKVSRSLPLDMAELIADRLLSGDVVDYISFRTVCKGWRSRTTSPLSLASCFRPRHWLMLADGDAYLHVGNDRRFLNLRTGRCLLLRLPELDSHTIFTASDGLLFLIDNSTRIMRMLNPFTRYLSDLPPLPKIDSNEVDIAVMIKAFNVSISSGDCNSPTAVMYSLFFGRVYFARPGDLNWASIPLRECLNSVVFFNHQWYITDYINGIQKFNPDLRSVEPLTSLKIHDGGQHDKYYLVEYNSEMYLVHYKPNYEQHVKSTDIKFDIFRVDLEDNRLTPITNIGDLGLFVGFRGRLLFLSSKDLPSLKGNSIYFIGGMCSGQIGVYDLHDREYISISVGTAVHDGEKRIGPSIRPFTLIDHLASFGSSLSWATGLMHHEFGVLPKGWFIPGCKVCDIQEKYSLFKTFWSDQR